MGKYNWTIQELLDEGLDLFDYDYPIFDEKYRPVLEQKIIDRYYVREIGLETPALFKHYLKMKLNEIMPYYNEQYLALEVFKTYDPYVNKDITMTEKRTSEQDNEASSSATNKGTSIYSDTPQARLSGQDYATNMNEDDATSTGKSSGKVKSTDDYIQTIKGFDGMKYASEVYIGVKETIVNFDLEILDELNELFMNIY